MTSMGRATTWAHRSETWTARDLGVISPKVTMSTVITTVARMMLALLSPRMEMAREVPTEVERMMKAFSVRRMVAKNFSCLATTRVTA